MIDIFILYIIGSVPASIWALIVLAWVRDHGKYQDVTYRQAYSIWNYKDDYCKLQKFKLRPIFTSLLWLTWISFQIPINLWMFLYSAPILFIIKLYETAPTDSVYSKLQNGIKFIFKG